MSPARATPGWVQVEVALDGQIFTDIRTVIGRPIIADVVKQQLDTAFDPCDSWPYRQCYACLAAAANRFMARVFTS